MNRLRRANRLRRLSSLFFAAGLGLLLVGQVARTDRTGARLRDAHERHRRPDHGRLPARRPRQGRARGRRRGRHPAQHARRRARRDARHRGHAAQGASAGDRLGRPGGSASGECGHVHHAWPRTSPPWRRAPTSAPRRPSSATARTSRTISKAKILEDTNALLRSISSLRNRDVDWALTTVADARSYTAEEAVEQGGVDGIARTIDEAPGLRRRPDSRGERSNR